MSEVAIFLVRNNDGSMSAHRHGCDCPIGQDRAQPPMIVRSVKELMDRTFSLSVGIREGSGLRPPETIHIQDCARPFPLTAPEPRSAQEQDSLHRALAVEELVAEYDRCLREVKRLRRSEARRHFQQAQGTGVPVSGPFVPMEVLREGFAAVSRALMYEKAFAVARSAITAEQGKQGELGASVPGVPLSTDSWSEREKDAVFFAFESVEKAVEKELSRSPQQGGLEAMLEVMERMGQVIFLNDVLHAMRKYRAYRKARD